MLILARRADVRGIPVETIEVRSDQTVSRSTATSISWAAARTGRRRWPPSASTPTAGCTGRSSRGAVLFAVCAGYQLVGTSFFAKGAQCAGPRTCSTCTPTGARRRAVGELAGTPDAGARPAHDHRLREPRRPHPPRARPHAAGPGQHAASATTAQPRACGRAGCSAPTCTGRRWPATRPSPTCCSAGRPAAPVAPIDDTWPGKLRAERLAAVRA